MSTEQDNEGGMSSADLACEATVQGWEYEIQGYYCSAQGQKWTRVTAEGKWSNALETLKEQTLNQPLVGFRIQRIRSGGGSGLGPKQPVDGGGWFQKEAAQYWPEALEFDGANQISRATGDQWQHEALYRTAKGAWIIHWTSAIKREDGENQTWRQISARAAVDWLISNAHEPPASLADVLADQEI